MNIIPLIPLRKFEKERAPECDELTMAKDDRRRVPAPVQAVQAVPR